jgi:hypothetical protein
MRTTQLLGNQRGNITVFVLTIFFFLSLLMFVLLFNMSTIFVDREVAVNSAQQASIAATQIVYEEAKSAIETYDRAITRLLNPEFLMPQVYSKEDFLRSEHPDWSDAEIRWNAIDHVLLSNLPGNGELSMYVSIGMAEAKRRLPDVVEAILRENGAKTSGSEVVMFNEDQRIQVETAVEYESETFGLQFLGTHRDEVKQTAESRRIGFLEVFRWPDTTLSL